MVLLDFLWLSVVVYAVLQIVLLARTRGTMRIVAAAPLFVMGPVFALTILLFVQQSNLWPLLMLFAGPFALLSVMVIALISAWRGTKAS